MLCARMRIPPFAAAAAFAIAFSASLAAQTVQVTIPCAQDATLYQDALGQTANDGGPSVFIGKNGFGEIRRALLKFDVAAFVPADAHVLSAQVRMNVVRSVQLIDHDTFLHRVITPWTEGTTIATGAGGDGTQARTGDTTWVHNEYPTSSWTTPGGDFDPAVSATAPISFTGTFAIGPALRMNADVQAWARGGANHGWLLRTGEQTVQDARRLDSRQTANAALRPVLVVTYLPKGNAADRGQGCVGSNGLPLVQRIVGAALRGASVTLQVGQGPANQATATMVGATFAPTPFDVLPGCPYELDQNPWTWIGPTSLDASGACSYAFTVPTDVSLLGFCLSLQSVAVDPTRTGDPFVFSNGTVVVFG